MCCRKNARRLSGNRSTHILSLVLVAATVAGSLRAADPSEITGAPNGGLHILVDGNELCGLEPFVADGGWKFLAPTAVNAPAGSPTRFQLKVGKDVIPGSVTVAEREGKTEVVWSFTPATDVAFNALAVGANFSVATMAGGKWDADDHHGAFPEVFAGAAVLGADVSSFEVTYPDGRTIKMTFPHPTRVSIQDNRQWGGPSFSLRIGKGIGKLAANEHYELALTLTSPAALHYRPEQPMIITANDEWIPMVDELDIVPGSALDLSSCGLIDGPCGTKGRVIITPEGHFAYANDPATPRRFYGVNLCFSAQYLPKENADQLLDRLVRLGYNAVRIHHYEFHLTKTDWKPGFDWSPEHVDQLDYLMAGCAKRGLWLTTDLYVSRLITGEQLGLPVEKPDFKMLVPVYEPAFKDWQTFARKFLDRVNPYTGKRIAEEPALAWISLVNEGGPPGDNVKQYPQWKSAWNRWLAKRFADRKSLQAALGDLNDKEDPAAETVAFPDKIKSASPRSLLCQAFLADTERAMFERMRQFLREDLKCPAFLTDINSCGPTPVPMQAARAAFDYVDDHFYVDHPVFFENQWHLPSRCNNTNPIREGAPGGCSSASLRVWGKPLTISEYDYAGPGRFRGVGGILTGALASLQDWDAIWRFAYCHKDKDISTPSPIDYFNLVSDPLNQAADRTALLLYLRRDLTVAPGRLAVALPLESLRNPSILSALSGTEAFAWNTRIGCALLDEKAQIPQDAVAIPLESAGDRAAVATRLRERHLLGAGPDTLIRSETGEIALDRKLGVLTIDTPRAAGGYSDPGQSIDATKAGVRIDGFTTGATVFVNSLERVPIKNAKRILVTHLTDLQNQGAHYGESARQTLLEWGTLPHLVRDGAAVVHLAMADPAAYEVWALSAGGRRLERIPATVDNSGLVFPVRVKATDGARLLYEVSVK